MAGSSQIKGIGQAEYHARILQLLQTAQYAEAERLCHWLNENGQPLDALTRFYLGVAQQFQNKFHLALQTFTQAHHSEPGNANIMQAMASCHEQLGQYQEAHQQLLHAKATTPNDAGLMANLGAISEKLGRPEVALNYYRQALSIDHKQLVAHMNCGQLLSGMGHRLKALKQCAVAYQAYPQSLSIIINLVNALMAVFNYPEALTYCEKGLVLQQNHARLLFKKGLILCCLRQYEAARSSLATARVIDPAVLEQALLQPSADPLIEYHLEPRLLYLDAMYQAQTRCHWPERDNYLAEFRYGLTHTDFLNNIEFAFHLLSLPLSPQERLSLTRNASAFIEDITWLKAVPPFSHAPRNRQKIRIGYFSSDFRAHPTGLLSRQLFALHDRNSFEVYVYSSFNPSGNDRVRASIEQDCDVFHDVSQLSDQAIALRIHQDEIDILVDMNGYTAKSRSCVMAMRPAPVQVLYLAYLHSMGADFIDYSLLDHAVAPPELEQDWHECIARLPHSLYLYDTDIPTTASNKTRADFALPEEAFVFCCLNTPYKIEPQIFDVWMEILQAVPHSVLWLLGTDELTIANLRSETAKYGIANERLIFAQPLPNAEHLQRYRFADLFIDTYWCGAHTTALDALWQGLPILCCEGQVSTARVGSSFLRVLEMPELIAQTFEQYCDKAIHYAQQPAALAALKQKLAENKVSGPLFNTALTVKHIEQAYQHMGHRYRQGLAPETFDVHDIRTSP